MAIGLMSAAATVCESTDWQASNLEVQKLLYLSHMRFLGRNDGLPLVNAVLQAWKYGPVIPDLYHKLKSFGNRPVSDVFLVTRNLELPEHRMIRKVVRHFAGRSPGELVEITHEPGGAWDIYFNPDIQDNVIPNDAIRREYLEEPF